MRPQLNHLGLYTPDIERMERFYVDVMGLAVTDRGRVARLGNVEIVFMSSHPSSHHQVALIGRPDLCRLYATAIAEAGRRTIEIDGTEAFLAGIRTLTELL